MSFPAVDGTCNVFHIYFGFTCYEKLFSSNVKLGKFSRKGSMVLFRVLCMFTRVDSAV